MTLPFSLLSLGPTELRNKMQELNKEDLNVHFGTEKADERIWLWISSLVAY